MSNRKGVRVKGRRRLLYAVGGLEEVGSETGHQDAGRCGTGWVYVASYRQRAHKLDNDDHVIHLVGR